jgi:hypothetical protein
MHIFSLLVRLWIWYNRIYFEHSVRCWGCHTQLKQCLWSPDFPRGQLFIQVQEKVASQLMLYGKCNRQSALRLERLWQLRKSCKTKGTRTESFKLWDCWTIQTLWHSSTASFPPQTRMSFTWIWFLNTSLKQCTELPSTTVAWTSECLWCMWNSTPIRWTRQPGPFTYLVHRLAVECLASFWVCNLYLIHSCQLWRWSSV